MHRLVGHIRKCSSRWWVMHSCMQVKKVNGCLKDEEGVGHYVEYVLVQVRVKEIHEPI